MAAERSLRLVNVGFEAGAIEAWLMPSWLKGGLLVKCSMTPQEARQAAIRLLQSAEAAERHQ